MIKLRIIAELEVNDDIMYGTDEEAKAWFYQVVLSSMLLVNEPEELGDDVGTMRIYEVQNPRTGEVIRLTPKEQTNE